MNVIPSGACLSTSLDLAGVSAPGSSATADTSGWSAPLASARCDQEALRQLLAGGALAAGASRAVVQVLRGMLSHLNATHDFVYPSLARLVTVTGLSLSTVRRAVAWLVERLGIQVVKASTCPGWRRDRQSGKWPSHGYNLSALRALLPDWCVPGRQGHQNQSSGPLGPPVSHNNNPSLFGCSEMNTIRAGTSGASPASPVVRELVALGVSLPVAVKMAGTRGWTLARVQMYAKRAKAAGAANVAGWVVRCWQGARAGVRSLSDHDERAIEREDTAARRVVRAPVAVGGAGGAAGGGGVPMPAACRAKLDALRSRLGGR